MENFFKNLCFQEITKKNWFYKNFLKKYFFYIFFGNFIEIQSKILFIILIEKIFNRKKLFLYIFFKLCYRTFLKTFIFVKFSLQNFCGKIYFFYFCFPKNTISNIIFCKNFKVYYFNVFLLISLYLIFMILFLLFSFHCLFISSSNLTQRFAVTDQALNNMTTWSEVSVPTSPDDDDYEVLLNRTEFQSRLNEFR